MTLEQEILNTANTAITKAIVENLTGYSGPLRKLTERVVEANEAALYKLINTQVAETINAETFKQELKAALNAKLGRLLIDAMGGEIEKRVNALKADPITRAKITLAIQQAVGA